MAQVATNDKFFASNHRVLQSSVRERYSRAFFFNPSHSVDIKPLQVEAVGGGSPRS
jgi:isopenicillin N synthase-like dioxygenase